MRCKDIERLIIDFPESELGPEEISTIKEHIELPGVRYDPRLGIFGMDVCVSMVKPGYHVGRRRRARSKVGTRHVLTDEEAKGFIKERFGVEVTEAT